MTRKTIKSLALGFYFCAMILALLGLFVAPVTAVDDVINLGDGESGESSSEARLSLADTTLTVQGFASPNAFVTLFDGNTPVGTVIAGPDGRFTKTLLGQRHGLHNIKAFYEDANGRTSSSVSRNVSLTPHANTNLQMYLPPTIEVDPPSAFVGDIVTFRGSTVPGAIVNVNIDGNTVVVAVANDLGNWFVTVDTEDYFVGTHVFEAFSSTIGLTSPNTDKSSFLITRPSPEDFLDDPSNDLPLIEPIITAPETRSLVGDPGVLITGTAAPNTQLEIRADGVIIGSVFSNARGEWNFPFTMTSNQHTITAFACIDGDCSQPSNEIVIFYEGDFGGCELMFRLDNYRFYGVSHRGGIDLELIELSGRGAHEMQLDWGDTTIENITIYRDGNLKFHHVYNHTGHFNGTITIEDANGCLLTQNFSVDVLTNRLFNWWWLLLATLPPGLAGINLYQHRLRHIDVRYVR